MKKCYVFITCLITLSYAVDAQQFPGGVTAAEVWYQANWDDINNNSYPNDAQNNILIKNSGEADTALFNFNAAVNTENLCLRYKAPLENTTGRNVFFVGEPTSNEPAYSHLGTLWNSQLNNEAETDSVIRNFFDVNNKNAISWDINAEYNSDKNAHINFYHTNHYNLDKKFKSYGQVGETDFYIGKLVNYDPNTSYPDEGFSGIFPEFISFARELSTNERQRVESYLALKYGVTLNSNLDYLNAQNKIFWRSRNNKIFADRHFGFGRDDISGLNQLQSESTHFKDHLVAAVGKIVETNMQKQGLISIPKDHFLVFGDNDGKLELIQDNDKNIRYWEKVWLAQATGQWINAQPIYFKLKLNAQMVDELTSNEGYVVWMLKDNHVDNQTLSDFSGEHIEYHLGTVDLEDGYVYFDKVYFDPDQNVFDQYTFGVGPNMIVQVQVNGCAGDDLTMTIVITGGKPKYSINIESDSEAYDEVTSNSTFTIPVNALEEYEITVTDQNGDYVQTLVIPEPWSFEVNLGPDQVLTSAQTSVVLDAGQYIQDANATFAWYRDGALLTETGSTLEADEPGIYEVIVTSGDLTCSVSDVIVLSLAEIELDINTVVGCTPEFNALTIEIESGFAPYTTQLIGDDNSTTYTHSGTTTILDLPYGVYDIVVTDAQGNTFVDAVQFTQPNENLGLDLYPQLLEACSSSTPCLDFSWSDDPLFSPILTDPDYLLDASIGVTNPNVSYEWFQDGQSLGIFTSEVTMTFGDSNCLTGDIPLFTVVIKDLSTNCEAAQSFYARGTCISPPPVYDSLHKGESLPTLSQEEEVKKEIPPSATRKTLTLNTRVYPNPTLVNAPFTYEVSYPEIFTGQVEVLTRTGELIQTIQIEGQQKYVLPLQLEMSSMYLIRTIATNGKTRSDQIIIN